jgi:drug/metabolite transporter (DMT)-like permease
LRWNLKATGSTAGIVLMLVGIALFAANDAMGKYLVATYAVGQIMLIRSLAALAVLAPFIRLEGRSILTPQRPGLHLLRAFGGAAESALFYAALFYLPLAQVMTFYLAAPIYVVALSALVLRERVGWRRWIAVLVGFAGVVVALGPSLSVASVGAVIAIVGSFAFAILIVLTRRLSDAGGTTLIAWQMAASAVVGLVLAPFAWTPPSATGLLALCLLGLVAMAAHVCVNRSLAVAEASVVVPFQYTLIIWAIVYGVLIFGDEPSAALFVGAGLIVGSGLFILMRERKKGLPPTALAVPEAIAEPDAKS